MNKLSSTAILLFITLFFSNALNAQDVDWKTISPAAEEFTLQMPNTYYKETQTNYVEDKDVRGSYHSFANKTYYLITTDKYAESFFADQIGVIATENSATKESIKFKRIKGNLYRFKDKDNFNNVVITVSTTKRNYVFHLLGYVLDQNGVNKFIRSIKFNKKARNGVPPKRPEFDKLTNISSNRFSKRLLGPKNAKKQLKKSGTDGGIGSGFGKGTGTGSGSGSGIGNGSGSGSGTGTGTGNSVPKSSQNVIKRTKMKVLSKAKPGYTEWARLYNVSGTVLVRVEFLANGKIGGVSVIQGLPLGLTERAIEAARLLEFVPPTRNNIPYSVNKVVRYNFLIY